MPVCISCNKAALEYAGQYQYHSKIFKKLFPQLQELRCTACGLYQVDHSRIGMGDLDQYYRENYRKDANIAKTNINQGYYWTLIARGRALAHLASQYKNPDQVGRIFELGAGYGLNLVEFGRVFPNAKLLSDDLNYKLSSSEFSRATIQDGPYDIVLISHVLEHLLYPQRIINKVVENMVDGGLLMIEVPNEGGAFIMQQRGGCPFHEPHVTFFNRDTLLTFFEKNFLDLRLLYIGTAGALIAEEQERRKRLRSGLRGKVRGFLALYPSLLQMVQNIFDKFTSAAQGAHAIELPDFGRNESRLYLRLVLQKRK